MEEAYFNDIRNRFCLTHEAINVGKMMSSEAITYQQKVFAFFSSKKKMVFKLGKDFDPASSKVEINQFSPFKNKRPLNGWFEIPFSDKEQWESFTEKALNQLKSEL